VIAVFSACSLWPESAPGKPPTDATTNLATTALETAPALVDSIASLVSSIVLGLILLSLAFRRSRLAIAGMLTALAEAVTYRINKWKVKAKVPPEEGTSDGS
jgi:hypothetical protein